MAFSIATASLPSSAQDAEPHAQWLPASMARDRARDLRRQGLVFLMSAADPNRSGDNDVDVDRALIRFARAARTLPRDRELHYFRAHALCVWRRTLPDGGVERRTDEAITAFSALRAIDPEYQADRVAFELGVLLFQMGNAARAADEFRTALARRVPQVSPDAFLPTDAERRLAELFASPSLARLHRFLAQSSMASENLEDALLHFQLGLDAPDGDDVSRALSRWGLALALERSDRHLDAIEVLARAIDEDPYPSDMPQVHLSHETHGPSALLHSDLASLPPGPDLAAYDALGWEAAAAQARGNRGLHERARRSWREFLALDSPRFRAEAEASLARLDHASNPAAATPAESRPR